MGAYASVKNARQRVVVQMAVRSLVQKLERKQPFAESAGVPGGSESRWQQRTLGQIHLIRLRMEV